MIILEVAANVLIVIGFLLIAKHKRIGWGVAVIAQILWVTFYILQKHFISVPVATVLVFVDILGYRKFV